MSTPGGFENLPVPEVPVACKDCEIAKLCLTGLQHLQGEMSAPRELWLRMRLASPAERQQLQEELADPDVTPAQARSEYITAVTVMRIVMAHCPNVRATALRPSSGPCSNEPFRRQQMLAPFSGVLAEYGPYQDATARLAEELSE